MKTIKLMLAVIVLLSFLSSFLYLSTPKIVKRIQIVKNFSISKNVSFNEVSIEVPAVDSEGNGVMATLRVEVEPGRGRALTNINQILFWVDTQHSIRKAMRVAENVTGIDLKNYDFVYSIETNASVIEGPSAGAAITIATIAALENKTLNNSVTITGTINHDGTIGPVGQIVAKGKAAKDHGKTLFLVPVGQSKQTVYKERKHCERYGFVTYCSTEIVPEKVDVESEVGIEVKEVRTVEEALRYFIVE
ncbi:MAG TPA: hypothetical protein ENG45_01075 [Candidatus Aenigmarchaeota archaeon]|nr:hypothetical protein [Candidatus Aenigmarchaeota archaeon]